MMPILIGFIYGAIVATVLWAVLLGNPAREVESNVTAPFAELNCALGGEP